jgi:uncharacterized membrane protein
MSWKTGRELAWRREHMTSNAHESADKPAGMPVVRKIEFSDLMAALSAGAKDFLAAPMFGLFFGGFFALGGLLMVLFIAKLDMHYMIYPLAIAFPLLGPFAAVGLYEVSRDIKQGRVLTWKGVLASVWAQKGRELSIMAFVTLFIMWVWMYQVRLLVAIFLGQKSFSTLGRFLDIVIHSPEGLKFLAVGHVVGALLYAALFTVTVVSIPLLLDREVDFVTAIITSVKAVIMNPVVMLVWALIVLVLTAGAMVPVFLGLFLVLPVLGHATWHLYERLVEPAAP